VRGSLYPFFPQDLLTINSDMIINGIQIFDILGRTVFEESEKIISSVDVRNYSKGVYIIELKTKYSKIITSKFVKQ